MARARRFIAAGVFRLSDTAPSVPRLPTRFNPAVASTRRVCLRACGADLSLADATSQDDHDLLLTPLTRPAHPGRHARLPAPLPSAAHVRRPFIATRPPVARVAAAVLPDAAAPVPPNNPLR
jgi:hypothetical protein